MPVPFRTFHFTLQSIILLVSDILFQNIRSMPLPHRLVLYALEAWNAHSAFRMFFRHPPPDIVHPEA